MNRLFGVCVIALVVIPATCAHSAVDLRCQPIIKASQARIAQPSWHSVTVIHANHSKMEFMKTGGKFYMRSNDGVWKKMSFSLDDTERKFLDQISKGDVPLSQCKNAGEETVEGVTTIAVSYRVELEKGKPSQESTLFIGKADGLPYQQTTNTFKVTYRYKNIVEPK